MEQLHILSIFLKLLTTFTISIGFTEGIIGGLNANLGQFKSVVSVQADSVHICGGTIISEQHVITAAKCVIDENNEFRNVKLRIVGGAINIKISESTPGIIMMDVDKIYTLKNYRPFKPGYSSKIHIDVGNIAVLKLVNKLDLSPTSSLSYSKLPQSPLAKSRYLRDFPSVIGFGIDSINKRQTDDGSTETCLNHCDKLKFSMTRVIEKKLCKEISVIPVQKSHICAKVQEGDDKGVCDGDIGNPLIITSLNMLVGIVSIPHEDCDEKVLPAIYTRVSTYSVFIQKALADELGYDMRMAYYYRSPDGASNLVEYFKFII